MNSRFFSSDYLTWIFMKQIIMWYWGDDLSHRVRKVMSVTREWVMGGALWPSGPLASGASPFHWDKRTSACKLSIIFYSGTFPNISKMKLEDVNQVARAHGLEERKSVNKTKLKVQEMKTELRAVDGKKGKKAFKRKREEIEERPFDWPSPSQSQSQGKACCFDSGPQWLTSLLQSFYPSS